MANQPRPTFDPERLKRERHEADLGGETETEHDHVAHEREDPGGVHPRDLPAGANPPAR